MEMMGIRCLFGKHNLKRCFQDGTPLDKVEVFRGSDDYRTCMNCGYGFNKVDGKWVKDKSLGGY